MALLSIPLVELCHLLNENIQSDVISSFHIKDETIYFKLKTTLNYPAELLLGARFDSFDKGFANFKMEGKGVKILSKLNVINDIVENALNDINYLDVDLPMIKLNANQAIATWIQGIKVKDLKIVQLQLEIQTI